MYVFQILLNKIIYINVFQILFNKIEMFSKKKKRTVPFVIENGFINISNSLANSVEKEYNRSEIV